MALTITVTNAGRAALVNAANTGTAPVVISHVGLSGSAVTPAKTATVLPGEFKRIATLSGDVVADDTIHMIVRDESSAVFTLRSLGLYLADGTLFAIYGQADPILEKAAQSMMLLAIDVQFADVDATQLTFGDANFLNPPATTEVQGVVELATVSEAQAGVDALRALTPSAARAAILGWLIAQDGAGSGLDADMLDGVQGQTYARRDQDNTFAGAIRRDANYYFDLIGPNPVFTVGPGSSWWYDRTLNAHNFSVGGTIQAAIGADGYFGARVGLKAGGNIVYHAGNDGAGSGLDADLLDGIDSATFARRDQPNTFAGAIRRDAGYGFDLVGGNPVFAVDALGASWWFDRTQGFHNFQTGNQVQGSVGADGYVNARVGMRAAGSLVWHAGNDGSGSGLDADLLDGIDGGTFARRDQANTFAGAVRRDAYYGFDMSGQNPVFTVADDGSSWWFDRGNRFHNFQISGATQASIDAGGYINARIGFKAAGNIVYHAGNDGAGSGLDADLLDGLDSATFARRDQANLFAGAIKREAYYGFDMLGPSPVFTVADDGSSWWYDRANKRHIFQIAAAAQASVDADGFLNARIGMRAANNLVYHVGNDGAGSGLDADLLDGQDSAAFAKSADFTFGSNARGYVERRPNGVIEQSGMFITPQIPAGSWAIWSADLPIPFPGAMLSATATLGNGGVGNGSAITVMDVGTPYSGGTDIVLPAPGATKISGFVQNNTGFASRMVIRWQCKGN